MDCIEAEVQDLRANCEKQIADLKMVCCSASLVRVDLNLNRAPAHRQITVCLRFPEDYPASPILVELKSRIYSEKLLTELTRLVDSEMATHYLGQPQALLALRFVQQYLHDNPLCICLEEIKKLRADVKAHSPAQTESQLKLKQRNSSVELIARGGEYVYRVTAVVPETYPEQSVELRDQSSNLPAVLVRYLNGQSREIARQCVEPPLRLSKEELANFRAARSLHRTLKFCLEATRDFHVELCPICGKTVLPEKPEDLVLEENAEGFVERVYCGHLFHQGCLKRFMAEPPFPKGGKLCPAQRRHPRSDAQSYMGKEATCGAGTSSSGVCGIKLAHDRWVVNVKTAEARWAQKQARQRELEEVVDFLK